MKPKLTVVFILMLLGIMACTSTTRPTQDQERFRIGTEGLHIEFLQNTPAAKIYDDQELNVLIQIQNKGASDLDGTANRIYLDGFSTDVITGTPISGKQIGRLEGKDRYNLDGDLTIIDFQGNIRNLGSRGIDRLPQTIKATVCYGYETIASIPVCIDPNPFSTRSEEIVCTGGRGTFSSGTGAGIGSTNLAGGQGAPVAVTDVQTESLPGRTKFRITIKNTGGQNGKGVAFRDGFAYLDRCNPYDPTGLDAFRDAGYVYLEDVDIDGMSIAGSCTPMKPDGHIQLFSNQAIIFCEYSNMPQSNPYVTPLTIKLRYGYRDSIVKQVTLLSLPD